ncbi:hypothetical protein [Halarcobacter sp.]|uniref:hypothetical protein n=1 Tax=Halarcobacter sp. TaxID=2321133 RepID=UPI0029F5110D|nr:hypothetical protein [Halarcobacter sp.]
MSILGQCPYCKGNVISKKFTTNGKQIKLYTCENAKKEYDESEQYVFTADSTCKFRVYSNAFLRWNKKSFSENEMKKLLREGQTIVRLHGRKGTGEYFKYVIPHEEYGISVLWDEEVEQTA